MCLCKGAVVNGLAIAFNVTFCEWRRIDSPAAAVAAASSPEIADRNHDAGLTIGRALRAELCSWLC